MAEPFTLIVVADCHIHPPKIAWPDAALTAFAGADLIVTLGDMGEASGVEALKAIAPVEGVRGEDDALDNPRARVVQAGGLRLGCVFDPVSQGLASSKEPFARAPDAAAAEERVFGGPVDVLLCASTHVPAIHQGPSQLVVDPGSVTLPTDGTSSFARLVIEAGKAHAEIVRL